ncbi:hypothetical protein EDC04DRAFT_2603839 [Pisolithus marmoratus]|nr:hypothetical protein EDC04DRAFT_2603839 [Pisolithus marmoratus]
MPGISLPAFPDNVPIHSLLTIDFKLLKEGNQVEIDQLWEVAVTCGFWYLKNHGAVKEVQVMFDLGAETFALPLEEKLKYKQGIRNLAEMLLTHLVARLPDMVEFLNIAKDDVLAFPDIVHCTYPSMSIEVNNTILWIFTQWQLGLPEGTLEGFHCGLPSDSKAEHFCTTSLEGCKSFSLETQWNYIKWSHPISQFMDMLFATTKVCCRDA